MTSIVEDINDRHMKPWADACQRDGIANTPLNPFIDQVNPLIDWLIDWLIKCKFIDWSIDQLIDWLIYIYIDLF